jgi:hypothetical protein
MGYLHQELQGKCAIDFTQKRKLPMTNVFYRPKYSCTAAVDFSPSAGKPEWVVKD